MARAKTVVTVISKISDRPAARDAALVVIYGLDLGRKFEVDRTALVIGRSSKADIQIDQESVSRKHAKLHSDGAEVRVVDLGSTNGTYVNDEAVSGERVLRNGDYIKIGRTIFKFIAGGNIETLYHEEIYRLTTVDGLTQIFNKRYFTDALEREVSRCRRYARELSLVMLDLDHFKLVNDQHGHLAGDFVLKELAALVCGKLRREDVFARYGGEEFAVIVPEVNLEGARALSDKIRKLVEKHRFRYEGKAIPITLSGGVASIEKGILDAAALLKNADAKLYEAKSGGRNRICP